MKKENQVNLGRRQLLKSTAAGTVLTGIGGAKLLNAKARAL